MVDAARKPGERPNLPVFAKRKDKLPSGPLKRAERLLLVLVIALLFLIPEDAGWHMLMGLTLAHILLVVTLRSLNARGVASVSALDNIEPPHSPAAPGQPAEKQQ